MKCLIKRGKKIILKILNIFQYPCIKHRAYGSLILIGSSQSLFLALFHPHPHNNLQPPQPIHPRRKHHHSLLPYPRAFKSSGNIPIGLLTINLGVSDSKDHTRAMIGPCWDHVFPSFISTLARAVNFSKLSQFGSRECQIFCIISGPYWDHVSSMSSIDLLVC